MTAVLAQWRASYAPGEWVALAGPTSLVVMLPSANGWTPLLDTLWSEVLQATSLIELAGKLSEHGLDAMPSFGAFFWTPAGMRSLVRGEVVVRDADTGAVVADGQGILTWSEIGLGDLDRIQIETAGTPAGPKLQLPLVVGAALASSLTLDARAEVSAPTAAEITELELEPEDPEEQTEPMSEADRAEMENGNTQLWGPPMLADSDDDRSVTTTAPLPAPPRLVISDGTTVELRQPVRIGRAPNANGAPDEVLLVTVRSPQQDISRSHLEVDVQGGQLVVTDLHSTNGTTVTRPEATGGPERLPSGESVPLPMGSLLDIGDNVLVWFEPGGLPQDRDTLEDH